MRSTANERTRGLCGLGRSDRRVLDQLAVRAVPVGAEFFGKARDLRRRVAHEDAKFFPAINRLIAPIDACTCAFPERKMRPEMLADLIQSWRFLDCRDFRLNLDAKLERTRWSTLVERRVFAGRTRFLDADWDGEEPDVAVTEISLSRSTAIGSIYPARHGSAGSALGVPEATSLRHHNFARPAVCGVVASSS